MNPIQKIFYLLVIALGLSASRQAVPRRMDLFLLIGQSNMAGRGPVDSAAYSPSPKIWAIGQDNQWNKAKDPLHFDKPTRVGVGPGLAFAERWLELNPEKNIGLIPCAVGGSAMDDWLPGQKHAQTGIYAYDAMLSRVREAQKYGTIRAILWHQGESDSNAEGSKVYQRKLADFFARLRQDIDVPSAPVLVGTLGDFFTKKNPNALPINEVLIKYPENHPNVYVVSASGLTHKGDTTHFDTPSARELGQRYANKLWEIQTKKK